MNKKQAIIIVSLMVLIVCAGLLATKLNDPFSALGSDSGKTTPSINDGSTAVSSNYFEEQRLTKSNASTQAVQGLKNIADDKNVSQDDRNNASSQAMAYINNSVTETKIESAIKGQGFQDALCYIDDGPKVRLVVKSKDNLTDQQARSIKDAIISISHINNFEIEVRQ